MTAVVVTGEIGAGKSTVSQLLAVRGADVVSADGLVSELYDHSQAMRDELAELLGADVVRDGKVNRSILTEKLFASESIRKSVESIVHPKVHAALVQIRQASTAAVFVYDVPIVRQREAMFDYYVNVVADTDVRKQRLVARGLSIRDAEQRILVQSHDQGRLKDFDVIIENSQTLTQLEAQVDALWSKVNV